MFRSAAFAFLQCLAVMISLYTTDAFTPATHVSNFRTTVQQQSSPLVLFGKNDKRTRKGKVRAKSHGNSRRKRANHDAPVDPYYTLREWGKRQEEPMSVEDVISMKLEKMTKKRMTAEELFASVTPF